MSLVGRERPKQVAAALAASFFAVAIASCASDPGGARRGGPDDTGRSTAGSSMEQGRPSGGGPQGAGGSCARSSVVTTEACVAKVRPPENQGSDAGCRSDAECVHGKQGRCVKNAALGGGLEPRPSVAARALMAGPPPPPPKTICVYDACERNSDCGPHARCGCDELRGRNACIALDSCSGDGDCSRGKLCQCGVNGKPNQCLPGDCRSDADCPGTTCEASYHGGSFCRTPGDRCKSSKECEKTGLWGVCEMLPGDDVWACHDYPLLPPG